MPKYRLSKIKTEHTIIDGIFDLLLPLSQLEEVNSITPGRIKKSKAHFPPQIKASVNTTSGLKLIAKSGRAVQEVFIATGNVEKVKEML